MTKLLEFKVPECERFLPVDVMYDEHDGFQVYLDGADITQFFICMMGNGFVIELMNELKAKNLDKRQVDKSHEQKERKAGA